jgi:predicted lipoprotein with Yx(FWY)xxD motif
MWKFSVLTIAALAALLVTAGVSSADTQGKRAAQVVISTRNVAGLGKILVDSQGRTLYMFVPDKRKKVTCVKVCAQIWPPVKAAKGEKLVGAGGVKQSLLGTDRDPAGGLVVTYAKWPLYTYVTDRKPGQATGQAVDSAGGLWYVLSPSGKVIEKKLP